MSAGGNFLGGIGQAIGSELSRTSDHPNQLIIPTDTPNQNPALTGINFDAFSQLGLGDANQLRQSGPLQNLARQINALPLDGKTKRRALSYLQGIGGFSDEANTALVALGLTVDDVPRLMDEQAQYDARIQELQEFSQPLQDQTLRNRLTAGAGVADLISGLASGGTGPLQDKFRQTFIRDTNRGLDDAEEQLLLRVRFGGFNPAAGQEQIAEQRGDLGRDSDLFALEKAFGIAAGVDQILGRASTNAQGAAGLGLNANSNAAQIAAAQATPANNLLAELTARNANARGEAVSTGIAAFGNFIPSGGGASPGATAPAAGG